MTATDSAETAQRGVDAWAAVALGALAAGAGMRVMRTTSPVTGCKMSFDGRSVVFHRVELVATLAR
ncbi:MAG: hypothetical protein R3E56_14765 [Burkholderiaceae bacterium]